MIHAYGEMYLDDGTKNLGEAFEFALAACGVDPDEFAARFLASRLAEEFGRGNPVYLSGMSGTELAISILSRTGYEKVFPEPVQAASLSAEYWCGWGLALYQWHSARSFAQITAAVPARELLQIYPAYHQAPEEKWIDYMDRRLQKAGNSGARLAGMRLQQMRRLYAYSQRILADRSGVNIRTLQQYETGAKDLNKASYATVAALARTLGCRPEMLIELF